MYAQIYATLHMTGTNHSTRGAVHTFDKYNQKHGCHIPHMVHMAQMLNGLIDPIVLHIYAITQPTATSTSHVTAKYALDTNTPTKLDVYAIYAQHLLHVSRR